MAWEIAAPGGFVVSDDRARLDLDAVHAFLTQHTYWAADRDRPTLERAVAHSLCLGLYAPEGAQAGFARALSDRAVRAHLADVFVLPAHRGRGLGRALVAAMLAHPELRMVGTFSLSTNDAHGLYAGFGFVVHPEPETQMLLRRRRAD